METLLQDLRYAARTLRRRPGFTIVAALTIAIALGANTALFSVVEALLLRRLPFADPDRLVLVWETTPRAAEGSNPRNEASPANFLDWRAQTRVFSTVAAVVPWRPTLTGVGEAERIEGRAVSRDFFRTLGVAPLLGRVFRPEEVKTGQNSVVVLSETFWRRAFGADSGVLGRTLRLNGAPYTIVGVMPARFQLPHPLPAPGDLWRPMTFEETENPTRRAHYLYPFARLAPGVSVSQAQAALDVLSRQLEQQYPETNTGWGALVAPMHDELVGDMRPILLVGFASVGFVLLIACANIANLLLARASGRSREVAIRAALGAARGRVIRQLLTESVFLSILGGLLALPLATAGITVLRRMGPEDIRLTAGLGFNAPVLLFSAGLTLAAGIVFGIAPALHAIRSSLSESLREGGRGAGASPIRRRLRDALVLAEVALAVVLLIGAGLTARSLARLLNVEPGFRPAGVLTFELALPQGTYGTAEQLLSFHRRLIDRLQSIPGAAKAGVVNNLPLARGNSTTGLTVQGRPVVPANETPEVNYRVASPSYFEALGVPIVRGSAFRDESTPRAERAIMLNETAVRRLFPSEDPIGKRVRLTADSLWLEIIGVVGDVRHSSLEEGVGADIYLPISYAPDPFVTVVVRTQGDPSALAPAARREVRALDPNLPIVAMRTMDDVVAASTSSRRFTTLLLGFFAVVALTLAAVGIYGVIAYAVTERTREIGVRIALGAEPRQILRLVMFDGARMIGLGLAIGVALSLAVAGVMRRLLFEVSARDPLVYLAAPLLLATIALLANYTPARRAMRVEPMRVLREE